MEFSYKVSEADFRQAWRLERKASSRSSLKTAAFWISIMLGLLLLYKFIQPGGQQAVASSPLFVAQASLNQSPDRLPGPVSTVSDSLERVGPFLVLAGVWILVVTTLVPMRLRYLYRRDPRMQAQFTVNITPDAISTENSAGTTSHSAWNVYEYWCEGKDIIVLMFHSGTYSILNLAGLSSLQRDELRGILAAALARR
jgi:hypothetical protein